MKKLQSEGLIDFFCLFASFHLSLKSFWRFKKKTNKQTTTKSIKQANKKKNRKMYSDYSFKQAKCQIYYSEILKTSVMPIQI